MCRLFGMFFKLTNREIEDTWNVFLLIIFFAVAYLNLGTSLIALGRCHEAASVLRDGTKLDGTGLRDRTAHETARISSLLQLGGLYADQGKLQRALAVYREALHTHPYNYPPQVSAMFFILITMSGNLNVVVNDYADTLCTVALSNQKAKQRLQNKRKCVIAN